MNCCEVRTEAAADLRKLCDELQLFMKLQLVVRKEERSSEIFDFRGGTNPRNEDWTYLTNQISIPSRCLGTELDILCGVYNFRLCAVRI